MSQFLIIDTDSYSGNFERELVSFVTGLYSDEQCHGESEADDFKVWAEEKGLDPYMFESVVVETNDPEYGWRYPIMFATPGRLNNGTGQHYNAAEGEKGWAAYESVGFAITRELTQEELEVIKERAELYCNENNIKIVGYRLLTKAVTVTSTEETRSL